MQIEIHCSGDRRQVTAGHAGALAEDLVTQTAEPTFACQTGHPESLLSRQRLDSHPDPESASQTATTESRQGGILEDGLGIQASSFATRERDSEDARRRSSASSRIVRQCGVEGRRNCVEPCRVQRRGEEHRRGNR